MTSDVETQRLMNGAGAAHRLVALNVDKILEETIARATARYCGIEIVRRPAARAGNPAGSGRATSIFSSPVISLTRLIRTISCTKSKKLPKRP
jgi:hypothetical protein